MKNNDQRYYWFAMRIFGEFTTIIAIPVVVFALIGSKLGKIYGHEPWFVLAGFEIAGLISGTIIHKKAHRLGKEFDKIDKKTGDK